jgi:5S rRNA maturation endonuclease (ribonuclease M5)
MEPVARYFLGDPNPRLSTRDELRWGSNGSLSVRPSEDQYYNHETKEGGGVLAFTMSQQLTDKAAAVAFLKENWPDHVTPKPNGDGRPHGRGVVEKTYPYVDERGVLLLQVVRKRDPKTFLQRRPVPKSPEHPDGWDWSVKSVRPVIYRLPQVLAAIAKGRMVLIVEGEKDVERLAEAGFVATTNAMGAGKWRPELNEFFRGADVVVIGDRDPAGQDHAEHVARQLAPFAKRVRLLRDLGEVWPECPPKGDVSDFLDAGKNAADLALLLSRLPDYRPAVVDSDDLLQPLAPLAITAIPPRRWAYGHYLLFGSAAVMGASDGVGKGVVTVGMLLSMITGQALLGERIWRTGPVAIVTYEDDEMEWRRRIAAGCLRHNLDYDRVIRSIYFFHRRITFGQPVEGGARILFPDSDLVIASLQQIGAVLLVIDPFNNAHDLESGNENVAIAKIAAEISRIAQATDAAVMANHHLRKGAVGNVDDLMGATALRANFRSCRILMRMTSDQAELLNIPTDEVYRYIRIVGSKENYAPPPEKSAWFKLQSQTLDNATDEYPDGDEAPVAIRWEPPVGFAGVSLPKLRAIFDALREGPGEGWYYSAEKRSRHAVDALIVEKAGVSKAQAGSILRIWQENGVVRGQPYTTPNRNTGMRVILDEAKVAAILAELRAFDDDLTSV